MLDQPRGSGAELARDVVIKGGTLVDPLLGESLEDIRLSEGRIKEVGPNLPENGAEIYDATGRYVFPGFIDPHVHLGFVSPFEEECATETLSAAAGGVTTLFHFAKILAYRETQVSYHEVIDEIAGQINSLAHVDVALHLQLGTYDQISEIPSYAARGLTSYKLFMSYKDDPAALSRGTVGVGDGEIFAALSQTARVPGTIPLVHCENWDLVRYFERGLRKRTARDFHDLVLAHPGLAEADHVRRVTYYASVAHSPLYIVHMTSKEGLGEANAYRKVARSPFYVETCPQYLVLDQYQAAEMVGAAAKTTPPVRDRQTQDALWSAIAREQIDTIGSDHAVASIDSKKTLWDGLGGISGVELGPALVVSSARRRGVPLTVVARIFAYNAARIFGLLPRKGTLTVGGDADIAIMNLDETRRISQGSLHSSADYTPYEGLNVDATVEATFLRGKAVWADRQLSSARPAGRLLLRERA